MRVRTDEQGKVIATENQTKAPESGLYCARDAKGVPVSEAGRLQEATKAPAALRARKSETPAAPAATQE